MNRSAPRFLACARQLVKACRFAWMSANSPISTAHLRGCRLDGSRQTHLRLITETILAHIGTDLNQIRADFPGCVNRRYFPSATEEMSFPRPHNFLQAAIDFPQARRAHFRRVTA